MDQEDRSVITYQLRFTLDDPRSKVQEVALRVWETLQKHEIAILYSAWHCSYHCKKDREVHELWFRFKAKPDCEELLNERFRALTALPSAEFGFSIRTKGFQTDSETFRRPDICAAIGEENMPELWRQLTDVSKKALGVLQQPSTEQQISNIARGAHSAFPHYYCWVCHIFQNILSLGRR